MNHLESAILDFGNWSNSSTFYDFVINNDLLSDVDRDVFQTIWAVALDRQNWSDSDLVIACKVTHNRLRNRVNLDDQAIAYVVRAASYEWR